MKDVCLSPPPKKKFTQLVLYVGHHRTNDQFRGCTCIDLSEGETPTQGDNPDVIPSHVAGMAGSLAVLDSFVWHLDKI